MTRNPTNRTALLTLLTLLTVPACSTHRSLTVSIDGAVNCTRSRDLSEHLGGLASLLSPLVGAAPEIPGGPEEEPTDGGILKSLLVAEEEARIAEAESLARVAEAEARVAEAEAIKAAVDACAQFLGGHR